MRKEKKGEVNSAELFGKVDRHKNAYKMSLYRFPRASRWICAEIHLAAVLNAIYTCITIIFCT